MFTGIVEATGTIKSIEGNKFTITHPFGEQFGVGESIALSGMCSTVLEATEQYFVVEIMLESRRRTTFGTCSVGEKVNLERSAQIGARNSGHFVTGHIDEVGKISSISRDGDAWRFRISFSPKNAELVVEKGSIGIDGCSMTVAACGRDWLEVCVISHTFAETLFGVKKEGDGVNLEFDILGKYILRKEELQE
jgi:riboflavin synthase